jgi:hypothetical protein
MLIEVGGIDDYKLRVLLALQDFVDLLKLVYNLHLSAIVLSLRLVAGLRLEDWQMEISLSSGELVKNAVLSQVFDTSLVTNVVDELKIALQGFVVVLPHDGGKGVLSED